MDEVCDRKTLGPKGAEINYQEHFSGRNAGKRELKLFFSLRVFFFTRPLTHSLALYSLHGRRTRFNRKSGGGATENVRARWLFPLLHRKTHVDYRVDPNTGFTFTGKKINRPLLRRRRDNRLRTGSTNKNKSYHYW